MMNYKIVFLITTFINLQILSSLNDRSKPFESIVEIESFVQSLIKDLPEPKAEIASEIRNNILENLDQKKCLSEYYWQQAYNNIDIDILDLKKLHIQPIMDREFPPHLIPEYNYFFQLFSSYIQKQQNLTIMYFEYREKYNKEKHRSILETKKTIQNCADELENCKSVHSENQSRFEEKLWKNSDNIAQYEKNKKKLLKALLPAVSLMMRPSPLTEGTVTLDLSSSTSPDMKLCFCKEVTPPTKKSFFKNPFMQ